MCFRLPNSGVSQVSRAYLSVRSTGVINYLRIVVVCNKMIFYDLYISKIDNLYFDVAARKGLLALLFGGHD